MWFFVYRGKPRGPVEEEALPDLIRDGHIAPDTPVWTEGLDGWQEASEVLSSLLDGKDEHAIPPPVPEGTAVPLYVPVPPGYPHSYLLWAVITTLLFCPPTGIVAIAHSVRAGSARARGDRRAAWDAARKAQQWIIFTLGMGILFWLMALVAAS